MSRPKTAIIIGSGFGGLGSACILAKAGWVVTVLEKNNQPGGRAGSFEVVYNTKTKTYKEMGPEGFVADYTQSSDDQHNKTYKGLHPASRGVTRIKTDRSEKVFRFDMGPSWYLMPDVFEHFFSLLGEKVADHLDLVKLAPSYRIFYKNNGQQVDIYSDLEKDLPTIEKLEKGAGDQLKKYLDQAGYQYSVAKDRFMYKNYDSIRDFFTREMALEGRKLNVLSNMDNHVRKYFKSDQMQKIMQYPLVFLGSSPYNTPAIYNIMSHIDFNLGVFYPRGGIYKIVESLVSIATKNGAEINTNSEVSKIIVRGGKAVGVELVSGAKLEADVIISNGDIHHTEQDLLDEEHRTKSKKYWQKRTLAPSALIMYLGVRGKIPSLTHHNLLFSKDWKQNFAEIFDDPKWPTDPSLYVCNPSKTDHGVAPKGHENLFVLVPIAPGLEYTEDRLEDYSDQILATLENQMNIPDLRKNIVYRRLFSVKDFASRYNSLRGTALGLAHTLKQTAVFRPSNVSKKVANLYFVGAGTNPGIGMPITLISAELMYKRLIGDKTAGPLKPNQL